MSEAARNRLHLALRGSDPVHGRALAFALHAVILASALMLTLQSMDSLPDAAHRALHVGEYIILAIFTVEYAARLWSAPDRLRYATSFWGIIDLLAILPAILMLLPDWQSLRLLRLLRAVRLLKLLRLSHAMARIERAFAESRDELILFTFAAVIILFIAAVGIHHFEHEAQPEKFGSIPAALWWALATLTTVGYGDVYPITIGGRIFTGFILLVGLGVIAIPASVITAALLRGHRRDDDRGKS
ncbi:voltage-gated potassium channel [Roseivivax lentus]|uniref:Voltage-gated potassium channel n=1 Tax=Roseivivax lentus TaxID=633194 RepID=A0A1N7KEF2_9RHOB|nr:ion transporter [Roseivivax lentus]SIS59971.1 voltage-gated potassium channel [Roseivivax lentus]